MGKGESLTQRAKREQMWMGCGLWHGMEWLGGRGAGRLESLRCQGFGDYGCHAGYVYLMGFLVKNILLFSIDL